MRLGDVIEVNPESVCAGYPHEEIEYIDISSVGTGTLEGTKRIPLNGAPSRAKRIVRNSNTLLATVRPNLRSFLYVRNPRANTIASTGFAVLRATDAINPRFLYYTVTNQPFTDYLTANAKGAAYPAVDTDTIERAEIYLPSLPAQEKIAAVLSAYDDLIENNLRRIRILEEMARNLYREWFVKFRFPGHEQTHMVDSPLGKIPEGWSVQKLGDSAEEVRRGIPKGKLEQPTPYIGLEHIPRKSLALDSWEIVTDLGSNKLTFEKGEVLFGKIRPYFHKVSVAPFHGICSADTIVIRPIKVEYSALITAVLSSEDFVAHATATSNGAKMPRANWKVLIEYPVVQPPADMLRQFSGFFGDVIAKQQNLIQKNTVLRQTRDLLLPKLISGELDVSTLPIATGREAA